MRVPVGNSELTDIISSFCHIVKYRLVSALVFNIAIDNASAVVDESSCLNSVIRKAFQRLASLVSLCVHHSPARKGQFGTHLSQIVKTMRDMPFGQEDGASLPHAVLVGDR